MPATIPTEPAPTPWWREPYLWLVIGGPVTVVVAGLATLVIAVSHPDPVLEQRPMTGSAHVPAQTGRNHAATPDAGARP